MWVGGAAILNNVIRETVSKDLKRVEFWSYWMTEERVFKAEEMTNAEPELGACLGSRWSMEGTGVVRLEGARGQPCTLRLESEFRRRVQAKEGLIDYSKGHGFFFQRDESFWLLC